MATLKKKDLVLGDGEPTVGGAQQDPKDVEIAALRARMGAMEDFITAQQTQTAPKRILERVARVMFINDLPAVVFGQAKQTDKTGRAFVIAITTIDKEGKTTEKDYDYIETIRDGVRYLCEIVRRDDTITTTHQGPIPIQHRTVASDPMTLRESGKQFESRIVMLEHTQMQSTANIKFLEGPWKGEELTVDVRCLNP